MKNKDIEKRLIKIEEEVKILKNELINKKSNNEEWKDKILEELNHWIIFQDLKNVKILLTGGYMLLCQEYYKHFYLSLIIQSVANILNEEPIDWKNWDQEKFYFYYSYDNNEIEFNYYTHINEGHIYFTKNAIEKANEILTNLNGLNILKMYFGVE